MLQCFNIRNECLCLVLVLVKSRVKISNSFNEGLQAKGELYTCYVQSLRSEFKYIVGGIKSRGV